MLYVWSLSGLDFKVSFFSFLHIYIYIYWRGCLSHRTWDFICAGWIRDNGENTMLRPLILHGNLSIMILVNPSALYVWWFSSNMIIIFAGSVRNETNYGKLHKSSLQRGYQSRFRIGQGRLSSRNKGHISPKPLTKSGRQPLIQPSDPCILCRENARLSPANPLTTLAKQRPRYENIRPTT